MVSCALTCAAEGPPLSHERLGVSNGCFVESVALIDSFNESFGSDGWARLLRWGAQKDDEDVQGHAVAVCESDGKLWCWDVNFGWKELKNPITEKEQAELISPALTARYPQISPKYPMYLEEFVQSPDPTPPQPVLETDNNAVRDASVAAAALAKHRPVYAVKFLYGVDGSESESAAVIFEYNGRIFIYAPDKGTYPSRVRGTVRNARVVAEMLRRLFPGARAIQPIGTN